MLIKIKKKKKTEIKKKKKTEVLLGEKKCRSLVDGGSLVLLDVLIEESAAKLRPSGAQNKLNYFCWL